MPDALCTLDKAKNAFPLVPVNRKMASYNGRDARRIEKLWNTDRKYYGIGKLRIRSTWMEEAWKWRVPTYFEDSFSQIFRISLIAMRQFSVKSSKIRDPGTFQIHIQQDCSSLLKSMSTSKFIFLVPRLRVSNQWEMVEVEIIFVMEICSVATFSLLLCIHMLLWMIICSRKCRTRCIHFHRHNFFFEGAHIYR